MATRVIYSNADVKGEIGYRPDGTPMSKFEVEQLNMEYDSAEYADFWRKMFLFFGLPATTFVAYYVFIRDYHEHSPVPFVPYSYMRIRTKAFPWGDGDTTLFHNPITNRGPDSPPIDEDEPVAENFITRFIRRYTFHADRCKDAYQDIIYHGYEKAAEFKSRQSFPHWFVPHPRTIIAPTMTENTMVLANEDFNIGMRDTAGLGLPRNSSN